MAKGVLLWRMRPKMRGRCESQSLVQKPCCMCLLSVTTFCLLAGSLQEREKRWVGQLDSFFSWKILPSLGGVPLFLSREQVTALPHSVTRGLEELFSSLVPPSENRDLYPLTPPRARKVKTAAILLCNLHNVGSCKSHINYP